MTDTHSHLNDPQFSADIPEVIARARDNGVGRMIVCSWDHASSLDAVRLAEGYDGVYAAVGVHPHDSSRWSASALNDIRKTAASDGVVAIGEIGLDYYYDSDIKTIQKECFCDQLALAKELDMPVSVHSRNAMADTVSLLREHPGAKGVIHFFTGDRNELRLVLDMGFYIGVDGPLTFKSSGDLRDVIRYVPSDRLLLETDCPYMAPVPMRGKRNEPYMIRFILEYLAELLGADRDLLERVTDGNAETLFGIKSLL